MEQINGITTNIGGLLFGLGFAAFMLFVVFLVIQSKVQDAANAQNLTGGSTPAKANKGDDVVSWDGVKSVYNQDNGKWEDIKVTYYKMRDASGRTKTTWRPYMADLGIGAGEGE